MKKHFWKFAALFALILVFSSCSREDISGEDSTDSPEDLAAAETFMQDADDMAAFKMDPDQLAEGGDCPTVTFAEPQGTFPNTVTLDFGDGCVCERTGRVKAGKIIITQDGEMLDEGTVRTITPENLTIDGVQIEGQRVVTNIGYNETGQVSFSVEVIAELTFNSGKTTSWEASRIRTWIAGFDTETVEDDVFEITGSSTGTNRCGHEFTATITEPLIASRACRWITQGEVTVSSGERSRTLDFGDGECDNDAVVTFGNGMTRNIKLKR